MTDNNLTAYDVAVQALAEAHKITDFGDGVDDLLNAADQIHTWLLNKAEFKEVPAPRFEYISDGDQESDVWIWRFPLGAADNYKPDLIKAYQRDSGWIRAMSPVSQLRELADDPSSSYQHVPESKVPAWAKEESK